MYIAEDLTDNLPFAAADQKTFSAVPRSDVAATVEPLIVEVSFDYQTAAYSCLRHWTPEEAVPLCAAAPEPSVEPADDVEIVAASANVVAVAAEAGFAEGLHARQYDFGPEVAVAGLEPGESPEVAGIELGRQVEAV